MRPTLFIPVLLAAAFSVGIANSATFTFVSNSRQSSVEDVWVRSHCNIRLEGEIVAGDAERFAAFLRQIGPQLEERPTDEARIAVLCLSSPGGSFNEAIRLAEAIRTGGSWTDRTQPFVATRVEANDACLSACAIIFMSGSEDGWESPRSIARSIHPLARLGFHAPSLDLPTGIYDEATVGAAYDISIDAIADVLRVLHVGADRSGNLFDGSSTWMDASLLAEMLSTPPSGMRMMRTVDDAGRWDIPVYPIVEIPLDERSGLRACENFADWEDARPSSTPEEWEYGVFIDRPVRDFEFNPEIRHMYYNINELEAIDCTISVRATGTYQISPVRMTGVRGNGSVLALYDPATPLSQLSTGEVAPQQAAVEVLLPSDGASVPWGPRFGGDRVSYWNHNGSGMAWESRGNQRWVWYFSPRSGIVEAGVTPGTLLFSGTLTNGQLSGQARIFSRECGPLAYDVSGPAVGTQVILEGLYQRRDDACNFGQFRRDRLSFEFIAPQP